MLIEILVVADWMWSVNYKRLWKNFKLVSVGEDEKVVEHLVLLRNATTCNTL